MSAFGTRQTLYERFFFGDPARAGARLCWSYDSSACVDRVVDFLNRLHGEEEQTSAAEIADLNDKDR